MRQPDDPGPDIDYDPTGYYARKEKHRAEMLPYVGACVIGIVLIVAGSAIWQAFA